MRVTIEQDDGQVLEFLVTQVEPIQPKEDPYRGETATAIAQADGDAAEPARAVEPEIEPIHPEAALCFLCEDIIDQAEDAWCFGCRRYICENHVQTTWGRHVPAAHDEP